MAATVLPLTTRRVLVIDDQESVRGVLEAALRDAGAEVITAEDGVRGLQAAGNQHPELILLDLAMPGMGGWEVLEALKGHPDTARIPVVLETSAEDLPTYSRARKEGVAAFISKPFRLGEVIETCRRILHGARPLQGTHGEEEEAPTVLVRDAGGRLHVGQLVDMDARGAQVELPDPLVVGSRVNITVPGSTGVATNHAAEVRWVTSEHGVFQHGLVLRRA